jgi:mono/diheme cytochrome c family protein
MNVTMIAKCSDVRVVACGVLLLCGVGMTAHAQERNPHRYKSGKEVYERICQACHMPDAKGAKGAGAYPALARNPNLENSLYPVVVILRGLKSMPAFSDLTDSEIVNVTNYIRTNFGNTFSDQVTVEQVKGLRPSAVQSKSGRAG